MRPQFKKRPILIGILASMVSASIIASESETFSLVEQAEVLFDGGSGSITGEYNGIPYEIIQGFAVAQGDMVIGHVMPNGILDVQLNLRGLGQQSAFDRWEDGIIPYQFSGGVPQSQIERAMLAVAHWNANTTMKLVERTPDNAEQYSDYVNFEIGGGCASYVGKIGGEQTVWLADNCTVGSIIHEIGHAVGLFHEHTRPDRGAYVGINLQNISSGKEINFETIEAGADTYSEYDYGSIMHYGEFFFSRNGDPTIVVPDGIEVGQRDALSALDISSVSNMYATDVKLSVNTFENEGNTQVNIDVTNLGELGAGDLQLRANWGASSDWLSVSNDSSGWLCERFDSELRCIRDSLAGDEQSRFSVLADPQGASIDELNIQVVARTADTDLSNNTFNMQSPEPVRIADISTEPGTTPEQPMVTEEETIDSATEQVAVENQNTVDTTTNLANELVDAGTNTNQVGIITATVDNSNASTVTSAATPNQNTMASAEQTTNGETTNTNLSSEPTLGAASESSSGGGGVFYLIALLFGFRVKRRT